MAYYILLGCFHGANPNRGSRKRENAQPPPMLALAAQSIEIPHAMSTSTSRATSASDTRDLGISALHS